MPPEPSVPPLDPVHPIEKCRLRRADDNNDILRLVNDNLLQSIEQTTSDPNAVGVRRRHTLPGLLVVFYPTEIGDFNPILRSNLVS